MVASANHRWVMAGIAEIKMACLQVEQSDKHGNKHSALVAFGKLCVQSGGYHVGHHSLF